MYIGVPVWALVWEIVYLMTEVPSAIPVMANPELLQDGTTKADNGDDAYPTPVRQGPRVGNSDPFVQIPLRSL
jgi:hypothetical protein